MSHSDAATTRASVAEAARTLAPVVWLVGKVQGGKTSIIRTLTGATDAEIGAGFRACTKTARSFDFPVEAPIIRFLDTRGLGEAAYDPAEDIAFCEDRAHLILAVVKALDAGQDVVVDTVSAARKRHPDWPVVVAQTTLHEAYPPGMGHIRPYPFRGGVAGEAVPETLTRALAYQRSLFARLPGRGAVSFVAIDFTQPGDGLDPPDYGREALIAALADVAPAAVKVALRELPGAVAEADARAVNAHILGFAVAAGASDALPVTGMITVPLLQAAMLRQVAKLHGVRWERRSYGEFLAAIGAGALLRTASTFGIRQLVKLVPVYGQTVGATAAAAASFATTYAVGKAATYYLAQRQRGLQADDVAAVYGEALRNAFGMAAERKEQAATTGGER